MHRKHTMSKIDTMRKTGPRMASRQSPGRVKSGPELRRLLACCGFTPDAAAEFLSVAPRTLHNWLAGRQSMPYSAFRLLRLYARQELCAAPGWDGWRFHSGMLWTPDGTGIDPKDAGDWVHLVRCAALVRRMYAERLELLERLRGVSGGEAPPISPSREPRAPAREAPRSYPGDVGTSWPVFAGFGLAQPWRQSRAIQTGIPAPARSAAHGLVSVPTSDTQEGKHDAL